MLEYVPLNVKNEETDKRSTLGVGESGAVTFWGSTRRKPRKMMIDFTGVVSATVARNYFEWKAAPETVRAFENGGGVLSDLLSVGQEVVYTFRFPKSARPPDNAVVGVRVRRMAAPPVRDPA